MGTPQSTMYTTREERGATDNILALVVLNNDVVKMLQEHKKNKMKVSLFVTRQKVSANRIWLVYHLSSLTKNQPDLHQ